MAKAKGSTTKAINENIIVSTWDNRAANSVAASILQTQPDALLDAIEQAVNTVENNENDMSVGYGGLPDNSGSVSLDACIMDNKGNAGSVCFLRDIKNAVSVARLIMERTPHVILAGEGAKQFALQNGIIESNLLSEKARKAYSEWQAKAIYDPKVNSERHDTIGLIAMDNKGNLSGACSTSGLAYKMPGRVGDSPIIGAGLYVDNEYGAASCTGYGELVLKSCTSYLVVELMRQGYNANSACKEAISRIIETQDVKNKQVGVIAISKTGEVAAYSVRQGFNYAVTIGTETILNEAPYLI